MWHSDARPQGPEIVMLPPDSAERELISILEPRIDDIQEVLENVVRQFALIQGARTDAEEDIDAEDRARFADRLKELREAFKNRPRGMGREAEFLSDMIQNAARNFFAKKSLKDRVLDQVAKQVDHFAFSQIERGMQLLLSPAFQIHVSPRGGRTRLQREFVSRVGTLTASIETNMFRQVRNALVGGVQEGQSLPELLASVVKGAANSKIRARLIARNEVNLLNFGVNRFIQQAIGIKKYKWITEDDEKVRARHKLRHKRIYSWDFQHSDGHPGVPPNCFPADSQVKVLGRTQVLMRHWYAGELTEISTDTDVTLRGTPNHPVLTRRGFVPLHLVDVGEDVFGPRKQAINGDKRNQDQRPASIGDCFETLAAVFGVELRRGSNLQFHGDGSNDEVEVVLLDSNLSTEWDVESCQKFCELVFARPNEGLSWVVLEKKRALLEAFEALGRPANSIVRGFCEALALFSSESLHSDSVLLRSASLLHASLSKAAINGSALAAELLRECEHTHFVIEVPRRYALNRKLLAIVCRATGAAIGDYAPSAEVLAEIVGMDTESKRDVFERQAGVEKIGCVVEKRTSEFPSSSHVYNLQSSCGWYVADSYLVHNCRCAAAPIIPLEIRATFLAPENRLKIQIREPLRPPFLGSRRRLHTLADVGLGDIPIIGPLFNPLG